MEKWINKKVLILGLSKSGISAAKYLNKQGADVFITELKEQKEEDKIKIEELNSLGIKIETGGHSDKFIEGSAIAVTSPGIPPQSEIFQRLEKAKIPVISEIELAYQESKKPFIAITGTNGKTTTTALVSHILSQDYIAPACGNIGSPPCDLLEEKIDYFVCEMSSYQIAMSSSIKPLIACWLNFTPDHLDWHGGLDNYFLAKAKLFKTPHTPKYAIFNALDENLLEFSKGINGESEVFLFAKEFDNNCCYVKNGKWKMENGKCDFSTSQLLNLSTNSSPPHLLTSSPNAPAIYFKQNGIEEHIIDLKDCPLVGEHNYQNIMCAVIIAKLVGLENEKIKNAIKTFRAPEHRLEYVRNYHEIDFYNDSKATNPEAAIVAIKSFHNDHSVLIAGGRDKNTNLKEFCQEIKKHMKTVILIGEAAQRFATNLNENGFDNIILATTLENAIDKAIELKPQVVLLSPACASFDMFNSYEHRGEVFKEYVLSKQ